MKAKIIEFYHRLKPIGLLFVPNIKTVVLLYVILMILLKRHTTNTFVAKLIGDYLTAFFNLLKKDCVANGLTTFTVIVNDNVKVYQKIIQKYTISTECCKGTKSLLYITYY